MAEVAAAPQDGPRIDALCYGKYSEEAVRNALAGGLTAVVYDIESYPRQYDTAVRELANWQERFANPALLLVRSADDIVRAQREKKLGIILGSQDASILGTSLADWRANLGLFHLLGLRVLQLTHNSRTHWADSYMEKRDGGLSRSGEELVKEMNARGFLIDLSHCSPQTLFDTIAVSSKPVTVTHAGCRALAPTWRNKSDEEIRAIGRNGGLFGVFNMTTWLTNRATASIDDVVAHIDHAVQLIGPAHVGFGSDGSLDRHDAEAETKGMARVQQYGSNPGGPSFEWPVRHVRVPELNAPDRLTRLGEALSKKGYSSADVNAICGGNFARVFRAAAG
ncbi:MAG TPA: membrane dipeptidase [Thermoanaerobaculia bacterium]|nr:membrane dipeptidase [Thermoanaerobaculia bacterium]